MSAVTILDNPEELLSEKEPTPGETPKRRRGRPPGSKNKSTAASFVKDFSDELDAMLKMLAMVWSVRDPVCGGVLNETSSLIAHDIAELAATSAKAREWLEKSMGVGKIVPLVMHLAPLLMTIRDHHLMPRTEDTGDGGTYPVA